MRPRALRIKRWCGENVRGCSECPFSRLREKAGMRAGAEGAG